MSKIEKIRKLIERGRVKDALELAHLAIEKSGNETDSNEVRSLSQRYATNERSNRMGIIANQEYAIERNAISFALLGLLTIWKKENRSPKVYDTITIQGDNNIIVSDAQDNQITIGKGLLSPKIMEKNLYYEHGYALLIGISYAHWIKKYKKHSALYATLNDVKNLKTHFLDSKKAAYKEENIIVLTEEKATAEGILNALDLLAEKVKTDIEATAIIYYSGHGGTNKQDYFLVPYDFDLEQWSKEKDVNSNNVVLSNDFACKINAISAKKSLIILDCCHAENIPIAIEKGVNSIAEPFLDKFLDNLEQSLDDIAPIQKGLTDELQKGIGRVILTSCRAEETSLAFRDYSLFTNVLLECLEGKENLKKDGWVRLIDMMDYIPKKVADRAIKRPSRHKQNPIFKRIEDIGADFIICAYDIATAKEMKNYENDIEAPPVPKPEQLTMDKEKIIILIDSDLDKALNLLGEIFHAQNPNGQFNDLQEQYIDPPMGFSKSQFRSRLKQFVNRNL